MSPLVLSLVCKFCHFSLYPKGNLLWNNSVHSCISFSHQKFEDRVALYFGIKWCLMKFAGARMFSSLKLTCVFCLYAWGILYCEPSSLARICVISECPFNIFRFSSSFLSDKCYCIIFLKIFIPFTKFLLSSYLCIWLS